MYFFGDISGLEICCKSVKNSVYHSALNKNMETVLEKDVNLDLYGLIKYYYLLTPKFTLNDICSLINKHHQHDVTERRVKYHVRTFALYISVYSADQINKKRAAA